MFLRIQALENIHSYRPLVGRLTQMLLIDATEPRLLSKILSNMIEVPIAHLKLWSMAMASIFPKFSGLIWGSHSGWTDDPNTLVIRALLY